MVDRGAAVTSRDPELDGRHDFDFFFGNGNGEP
jgi:hypothetical protein